ncbi:Nucleic-acid-binding protein from transposon X-element [Eumeta japonica]|uniref:Nucleic-acid-binding protein from transposon X-element n=1 Tax=Eumeta variegata TaxID=151549 RepID=A0A4C1XSV7_EUMVA|nr:Nucleic-acid-binding protein from transposon X-element [Eumeta japonica]
MANVAPRLAAAGGSQKSQMSLPMGELKALFITFLKQQGYEVPVEFNNFINAAVSKISSRDSSPYDEAANSFKIVKRKSRKVARRRKNSNKNNSSDESDHGSRTQSRQKTSPSRLTSLPDKSVTKRRSLPEAIDRRCPYRQNGTPLGMVLVILERNDEAREIFKNLARVCGLSGVTPEEPYKRGMPSQCHRCQLYGHAAANCFAQPRCVKCLVPHWTKDCERNKESGGKPSCCNCGKDHTANYGGCSEAPRPKPIKTRNLNRAEISHTGERRRADSRPPPSDINKWKNPLPWVKPKATPEPNGSLLLTHHVVPGPRRPPWGT